MTAGSTSFFFVALDLILITGVAKNKNLYKLYLSISDSNKLFFSTSVYKFNPGKTLLQILILSSNRPKR